MVLLVGLSEMMLREGIGNRPPLPEDLPPGSDRASMRRTAARQPGKGCA